ncbi:MAG: hypothetical protein A2X42_06210 [Candidatus Margulisbacteria bacterium GWF2_38_17]|nr:MAG: hypothetical protein A2X43_02975 [Candidatus Margulisbacteria bacterium GWD2_39_127]OGI01204.1 MAG: hypothetical protein A2X42_06210 [Candidatus Margulisbacteria bacterium GWF2_38_17]OGI09839.1 MAG: hypothetical protein A2X41_09930 [Candidatus Margulisbacteria bacterium GWE2_39_32]
MSKEEIMKNVQDQLYWDSRVDASDISVEVKGDKVTLFGSVSDYFGKKVAQKDAYNVPGVTSVRNELIVHFRPGLELPSDKEISSRVRDILLWNPSIEAAHINIEVQKGSVTISGTVDAYWKRHLAEDLTCKIKGVAKIINELAVVPANNLSDQAIAENIIAAFNRDRNITVDTVDIKVEKGKVTVRGSVPTWAGFHSILDVIRHTPGVIDIIDFLRFG